MGFGFEDLKGLKINVLRLKAVRGIRGYIVYSRDSCGLID